MVEFDRLEDGRYIDSIGESRLDTLEGEIIDTWDYISDGGDRYGGEMDEIYIFGSWARGTAIPGESDLDVVIFLEGVHESQEFDVNRMWMAAEISDMAEQSLRFTEFDGYDIFIEDSYNKQAITKEKMKETREGRVEGERQVYSLTDRRYYNG